jgi:hypothetical protein
MKRASFDFDSRLLTLACSSVAVPVGSATAGYHIEGAHDFGGRCGRAVCAAQYTVRVYLNFNPTIILDVSTAIKNNKYIIIKINYINGD